MLHDLQKNINQKPISTIRNTVNYDRQITSNIVDIIFGHIQRCLNQDRCQVKLDMLTKGIIKSTLPATVTGTKKYIFGMHADDVKLLLDDIERELVNR